jgi:uncharacterized protein YdhG (YjbR/CyaY superfamily)
MNAKTVEEYLTRVTPGQQAELERVRRIILAVAPHAEETISYGMPTYKVDGKRLIYFAAFEDHMSLFGTLGPLEDKLGAYNLTHKGTVQFTEENPIPDELIEEIVRYRLANLDRQ